MSLTTSQLQSVQHYNRVLITHIQEHTTLDKYILSMAYEMGEAKATVQERRRELKNSRKKLARLVKTQKAVKEALKEAYASEKADNIVYVFGEHKE